LTPKLDTVIIEEPSVKGLSLRLYRTKHLPSWNGTYGDTGFYSVQTTYLSMKVQLLNIRIFFFLNHCWPKLWSHFSDHTKHHPDLQLWSLV